MINKFRKLEESRGESNMKKGLIRLWNNRKFRTFMQTFLSTILTYFIGKTYFDLNANAVICLIISALATSLSAIMPILDEEGD